MGHAPCKRTSLVILVYTNHAILLLAITFHCPYLMGLDDVHKVNVQLRNQASVNVSTEAGAEAEAVAEAMAFIRSMLGLTDKSSLC